MTEAIWSKSHVDLNGTEFYSAVVREHHWDGWYVFQAYPNQGDHCIECKSKDKDDLIAKAERWFKGDMPSDFYSAAY